MIRVVAVDLDTTLLADDGRVAAADASAITRAVEAGVRVVLVTSRVVESARRVWPLDLPLVAADGAQISLSGSTSLAQHALPGSRATSTASLLAGRGLAVAALAADGLVGARAFAPVAERVVPGAGARFRHGEVPARSVLALYALGSHEHVQETALGLRETERRAFTRTDVLPIDERSSALRIRGSHATRARALAVLASRWNVRRPACAYVGSARTDRDLDAVAWAGRSVVTAGPAAPRMPCVSLTRSGPPGVVAEAFDHLLSRGQRPSRSGRDEGNTPTEIESDVSAQRATCHQPLGR